MRKQATDHGIVLKKLRLPNNNVSLNIFSEKSGKMHLMAYGVRKITSRRLSHLETGNYITFSYRNDDGRIFLVETELVFGYSAIKSNALKLNKVYSVLQFLNKILPENEPEPEVFADTMALFKKLNNSDSLKTMSEEKYLQSMLQKLGYIDQQTAIMATFDVYEFIRELTGLKLQ